MEHDHAAVLSEFDAQVRRGIEPGLSVVTGLSRGG
jgi:hypothetical protein